MNKQNSNDTLALFTHFQYNLNTYTSINSERASQLSMHENLTSILDEIRQSSKLTKLIITQNNKRDHFYSERTVTKRLMNISYAFENKDIQLQMHRDINASSFNQSSIKNLHLFYHSFNEFILLKEQISCMLFKILQTIVKSAFEARAIDQSNKKNFILGRIESIKKYKLSLKLKDNKDIISMSKFSTPKTQRRFVTNDEYSKLTTMKLRKSISEVFIKKQEHKQLVSNIKLAKKPLPLISTTNIYPIDTNANSINVQSILQSKATFKNFDNLSSNLNKKVKEQLKNRILAVKKSNATLSQRTLQSAVSYDYFPLFSSNSRIKSKK